MCAKTINFFFIINACRTYIKLCYRHRPNIHICQNRPEHPPCLSRPPIVHSLAEYTPPATESAHSSHPPWSDSCSRSRRAAPWPPRQCPWWWSGSAATRPARPWTWRGSRATRRWARACGRTRGTRPPPDTRRTARPTAAAGWSARAAAAGAAPTPCSAWVGLASSRGPRPLCVSWWVAFEGASRAILLELY